MQGVQLGRVVVGLAVMLGVGSGCRYTPPAPATPAQDEPVAASFDATWSAVIDLFGEQQIPVETLEKASGFIVARRLWPNTDLGIQSADCGKRGSSGYLPQHVRFNVRVKPAGERSTIRVNAEFSRADGLPCHSTGVWERQLTARVHRRVAGIGP